MQQVFRQTDTICRYGGEEFVILMPRAQTSDCLARAEALRRRVAADPIDHAGQRLEPVTLSAGIASWPEMTPDPQHLLDYADQALYRAKQAGRNRIESSA